MSRVEKKIKDLADKLGVSTRTLKTWEQKGLIKKPRRNKWDHRIYNDKEFKEYVDFIKKNNYFRNPVT